jgi:protein TonB
MTDLTLRAAALAASALLHVLLYGALGLAPEWTPPPRTGLVITELIVSEAPAPPVEPRRLVTPPRPRSKDRALSAPPESTPATQPPIERDVSEPPAVSQPTSAVKPAPAVEPTIAALDETTVRDVTEALAAPSPPAPQGTDGAGPRSMTTSEDRGPTVAALPPDAAAAPGALTRTAIPRGGYQVTPSYPQTARRLGIEGTTLLSVFVDSRGRVADVVVKQSAGHPDLDRAATNAVRRWRFEPARRGAEPVAMWVELPVEFNLR